jgi:hypothetical protein
MNTMTMPGFVGDRSLYRTHRSYRTGGHSRQTSAVVVPQIAGVRTARIDWMCFDYNVLCALGHMPACYMAIVCALAYETIYG